MQVVADTSNLPEIYISLMTAVGKFPAWGCFKCTSSMSKDYHIVMVLGPYWKLISSFPLLPLRDYLFANILYLICNDYILLLQNLSQARGTGRRLTTSETESLSNLDSRNMRRPSSSSVAGGLPPLGRWWTYRTALIFCIYFVAFSTLQPLNWYYLLVCLW